MQLLKDAAEIIGLAPGELMTLEKPMYSQIDARRQWFSSASFESLNVALRQNPLDPFVFLSYKVQGKVDGFVLLYVDEIKGDGDTDGKGDSRRNSRLHHIKAAFQVSNLVQRSSHA